MRCVAGSSTDSADVRRIVVTGASGFVGRHALAHFAARGWLAIGCLRCEPAREPPTGATFSFVGEVGPATRWDDVLAAGDVIVHCAALAHVHEREAAARVDDFHRVNVEGTRALAQAAVRAGCRRLVLVSSIGVNGSRTVHGRAFVESDPPDPRGVYAHSKLLAEQALQQVASGSALEWSIVRPALVFGPGVTGNVERLLGLVASGLWLPFGSIDNRRCMVSVAALCELLELAASHAAATCRVFLAAEAPPFSTPALVRALATGIGRPVRLLSVPPAVLRIAGALTGCAGEVGRLCDSLEIDASAAREVLGWQPQRSIDERIVDAARAWRRARLR